MKVLLIGGTGTISSACSEYCIKKGHELFLYNRAQSIRKPAEGANVIEGDYKNRKLTSSLLDNKYFSIVEFKEKRFPNSRLYNRPVAVSA